MSNLQPLERLTPRAVWDGVAARIVDGERISMAIVELDPDGIVPEHHHPHEQLGLVIEGEVTFTVGSETRTLGPGGTWRIVGETPHEVRAGADGAVVVDIFTPVREDWAQLAPAPARPPRWPG